jgi:antitoxin ParD1/3/4
VYDNAPAQAGKEGRQLLPIPAILNEEGSMPTRNVNLTDHYDNFIEASIAEGRFANASEAVRAGLSLLERQAVEDKTRLSWLRAATEKAFAALDGGEGVLLNSADDIDSFRGWRSAGAPGRARRRACYSGSKLRALALVAAALTDREKAFTPGL